MIIRKIFGAISLLLAIILMTITTLSAFLSKTETPIIDYVLFGLLAILAIVFLLIGLLLYTESNWTHITGITMLTGAFTTIITITTLSILHYAVDLSAIITAIDAHYFNDYQLGTRAYLVPAIIGVVLYFWNKWIGSPLEKEQSLMA